MFGAGGGGAQSTWNRPGYDLYGKTERDLLPKAPPTSGGVSLRKSMTS